MRAHFRGIGDRIVTIDWITAIVMKGFQMPGNTFASVAFWTAQDRPVRIVHNGGREKAPTAICGKSAPAGDGDEIDVRGDFPLRGTHRYARVDSVDASWRRGPPAMAPAR